VGEQVLGNAHVGERPDAAGRHEARQAAKPRPAAETPIAVGEDVVDGEVEYHRNARRGRLGDGERGRTGREEKREHCHVHEHACAAHQREGDKAHRHPAADGLVEQQHRVFPRDLAVELALAVAAVAEGVAHLGEAQRPGAGGEQVDQDLEAERRELAHGIHERCAGHHEVSAHRIAEFRRHEPPGQARGQTADPRPSGIPAAEAPPARMAAADNDVESLLFQAREHFRQNRLVVLQVGVHHRHVRCAGGENALDACGRQAAPADPLHAAHPRIARGERPNGLARGVAGVVVDEHHLPGDAGQRLFERAHQFRHVFALVERGHNDGEFACDGRDPALDGRGRFARHFVLIVMRDESLGNLLHFGGDVVVIAVDRATIPKQETREHASRPLALACQPQVQAYRERGRDRLTPIVGNPMLLPTSRHAHQRIATPSEPALQSYRAMQRGLLRSDSMSAGNDAARRRRTHQRTKGGSAALCSCCSVATEALRQWLTSTPRQMPICAS
jgi:hypothetical protein